MLLHSFQGASMLKPQNEVGKKTRKKYVCISES